MRIAFDMDGVLADMDRALAVLADEMFGRDAGGKNAASGTVTPAVIAEPPARKRGPWASSGKSVFGSERHSSVRSPIAAPPPDSIPGAASEEAPPEPVLEPLQVLTRLNQRQQSQLWRRVRETRDFWTKLDETEPGVVTRLAQLSKELQWDVLFITQRPSTAGSTVQLQTQRWLRKHGFEMPSVFTTQGSRGKIAAALTLDAVVDDRIENCVDVASDSKAWPVLVWRGAGDVSSIEAGAKRMGIAVMRSTIEAIAKIEEADRTPAPQEQSLFDRLKQTLGVTKR